MRPRNTMFACGTMIALILHGTAIGETTPSPAGDQLTLQDCMSIVRTGHPSIKNSAQRVFSSNQDVIAARSEFLPHIEANFGTDLWRRSPGNPVTGLVPGIDSEPSASVGINWKVFGARTPLQYSRARIERERTDMLHLDTVRNLESHLVSVYYTFLQAQQVLALELDVYSLQKDENDLSQKRVQMGSSSPLAGISGEEALLRTKLSMLRAEEAQHRAAAELSLLLGRECPVNQPLEDIAHAAPHGARAETDWLRTALSRREDLDASKAATRAARRSAAIALWERLPDINLGVEYGIRRDSFYGSGSLPFTTGNLDRGASWAFGLGVSVPIFAGGSLRARHRKAESSLTQAEYSLLLKEREVERDVRSAWARFKTAREIAIIRARELDLVNERLKYIQRLYEAGTRYQRVDWQRARVNVARKEVDLVRARVAAQETWVQLLRSAGLPLDATGPVKADNEKEVSDR